MKQDFRAVIDLTVEIPDQCPTQEAIQATLQQIGAMLYSTPGIRASRLVVASDGLKQEMTLGRVQSVLQVVDPDSRVPVNLEP